ncbi:aminodeoxychorismate lyase [Psychromonas sp.]|uniref:aminodeoxychorismate lyase n=1 Tax=Psychromonas sp. TaxID=1884585 RepID=UPI003562C529
MLINGIESTTIAADDRGLAYGDGLFSTIKVEHGVAQLWDYHLQRLQSGAQKLFFPEVDWSTLSDELHCLAKSLSGQRYAVIKVILTRGSGGRGYSIQGCHAPQRILSVHPYPDFYQQWQTQGLKVIQCQQQLAINRQLAGLKTLNRLEQVLIKHELESQQALEGVVCDNNGYVIEACGANIFIYMNNHWVTPKLDGCGVQGVKRRQIMELSALAGHPVREMQITTNDLLNAEAVCLSNALMGIVPVIAYQSHYYPESAFAHVKKLQTLVDKGGVQNDD